MAPKTAMKRASVGRASSAKRVKRGTSVAAKSANVADALEDATSLPEAVREMLATMIPKCLADVKDKRHAFQTTIIDTVAKALAEIEAGSKAEVAAAQAKVDGAEQEKASREATQTAAQGTHAQKSEAVSQRKAELAESQKNVKASKDKLSATQLAQSKGDMDLEDASGKKEKLEAAFTNTYIKMRDGASIEELGSVKNKEKMLSAFIKMLGRDFHIDKTMLETLPVALLRDPASRGHFDGVVLTQIEGEVQRLLQGLQATLTAGEPDKLARAGAVNAAESELEQSIQAKTTCAANLKAADDEEKEANRTATAASNAVDAFESDLAEVKSTLEEASGVLSDFIEGPLTSFIELRERVTPPPPAPKTEAAAEPAGVPAAAA